MDGIKSILKEQENCEWQIHLLFIAMMRSKLALTKLHTNIQLHKLFRNKRRLYLQWALPSSGHPCPWFPLSSWGIGHLCPVWWQRGNCLTFHTTDTHKCFTHALGLD